MKNKFAVSFITAVSAVLFGTANAVFAAKQLQFIEQGSYLSKLLWTMLGTGAFFILLFTGLTIYNKILAASKEGKNYKLNRDSLRTPQDKDEALLMYLTKNKLK